MSDGLEAVLKAAELQPDLILLDIGLPNLNGIGAARRIRNVAPESKILFLSQELDPDVVRAAFDAGGHGYVVKSDADEELFTAVEALMLGRKFVSRGLVGQALAGVVDSQTVDELRREGIVAERRSASREIGPCHAVQFYADDAFFLAGFTRFISVALKAGNAAIVLATQSHRDGLLQRLQAEGSDIRAAINQGRYVALDAAATLATFMTNDLPDPVRFLNVVTDLIATATRAAKGQHPCVVACGECAPLLWAEGKVDAAIRLEELWNEIALTYDVDILCGYSSGSSFRCEEDNQVFRRICEQHSAVHP